MRKIKKPIIILLLTLCVFILSGWGKKAADLLNDTSLIDLNKAIKEVPIGKQDNTLASEENELEDDDAIMVSQMETIPDKEPAISQEKKKELYIITIRDKTIKYNNSEYNDANALMNKIRIDYINGEGSVFYLEDDYAEAHVYNEVLAGLKNLNETIGLKYDYD